MKDKARTGFVFVILLDVFEVARMKICKGFNGTSCCSGYEWDQGQSMCKPCKKGYHGRNCGFKCPPLFSGWGCQSPCNCSAEDCDYINGCRQIIEEQPYDFTISSNNNVKTTKLNDYEHSYNEKPNATVVKDGTVIMQPVHTSKETAHYQSHSLMYAIIGVSVVAVLITIIYIYTSQLEKRVIPTSAV